MLASRRLPGEPVQYQPDGVAYITDDKGRTSTQSALPYVQPELNDPPLQSASLGPHWLPYRARRFFGSFREANLNVTPNMQPNHTNATFLFGGLPRFQFGWRFYPALDLRSYPPDLQSNDWRNMLRLTPPVIPSRAVQYASVRQGVVNAANQNQNRWTIPNIVRPRGVQNTSQ